MFASDTQRLALRYVALRNVTLRYVLLRVAGKWPLNSVIFDRSKSELSLIPVQNAADSLPSRSFRPFAIFVCTFVVMGSSHTIHCGI